MNGSLSQPASVVADMHLHVYPSYDFGKYLSALVSNLRVVGGNAARCGLLAERHDCHFFRDLVRGGVDLSGSGFAARPCAGPGAVCITRDGADEVTLVAGRQINTAERVEVLALACDADLPDGRPIDESIEAARAAGGVPVVSWAPGKWLGRRGSIVAGTVARLGHGHVLLGDTALRPSGWPEPSLMREARQAGACVPSGSDPLPQQGEESRPGSYATLFSGGYDVARPVESMRRLLLECGAGSRSVGGRLGILPVMFRLLRHARSGTGCA